MPMRFSENGEFRDVSGIPTIFVGESPFTIWLFNIAMENHHAINR